MNRLALVAMAAALTAAGCARDPGEGISYLGLSDVEAAETDDKTVEHSDAVRHVQSNKVLGAMAFQKVTGQTVDPSRLTGSGQ